MTCERRRRCATPVFGEHTFVVTATILCMNEPTMKVLVCRPRTVPAPPPIELRRPDICRGRDGELLRPPVVLCVGSESCCCAWSFAGVSSLLPSSWGVVETRTLSQLLRAARSPSNQCAGPFRQGACGACAAVASGIRDINRRIATLRAGSIVGIWTLPDGSFSLYSRRRARSPQVRRTTGAGWAA